MSRREFIGAALGIFGAALLGAVGGMTDGREPRHRERGGEEPP